MFILLVSYFLGKTFPFFGLQYHPEKTIFEWADTLNIPHSLQAIRFSQVMADNFVQTARTNKHRLTDKNILKEFLMSQQSPLYTGFITQSHSPFQQIYVY